MYHLPPSVKINCSPQRKSHSEWKTVLAEYKLRAPLLLPMCIPHFFSALYSRMLPGLFEKFLLLAPSSSL